MSQLITVDDLNALSAAEFEAALAPIFENSPWVARSVSSARPFASLTALHKAMVAVLESRSADELVAFLREHPRLSKGALKRGGMTAESVHEQSSARLDALDEEAGRKLDAMNEAYEARFGYPFILAIRHASPAALMAAFERRLLAGPEAERRESLAEVAAIGWMRLLDRIRPAPTGAISTHVLDAVRAAPAAGLEVELWRRDPAGATRLLGFTTDPHGRSDRHLLGGGGLQAGSYELHYDTAAYFAGHGHGTTSRSFLGKVQVAFGVWNPEEHFHVPVLLSPGSYTTYRGT